MELKMILILARRWVWLLIVGLALGSVAGFAASRYQTPIFRASTQVLVMRAPESAVSNVANLSDQELIQTYIELLTTKPVLEQTSRLLGFGIDGGQISARQVAGTKLLEVIVQDTEADRAALIANQIVDVLITQNEAVQASLYSSSEESLQVQIAQVEEQIASLQSDIAQRSQANIETEQQQVAVERQELENLIFTLQRSIASIELELEALTPQSEVGNQVALTLSEEQQTQFINLRSALARKQFSLNLAQQRYFSLVIPEGSSGSTTEEARQSQQQATLALYQQIYSTLLSNYEAVRLARLQNTANVIQVEPATPPVSSIPPRPLTLMGAIAGLIIAGGLAFVIEYLDVTIKTPDDVLQVLGLPVIGYIGTIPNKDKGKRLQVLEKPHSLMAESLRTLWVNIEFADAGRPLKTILFTSPGLGQGKTTVASNLAVVMAQAGHKVLLIDANLRRPTQHSVFSLSNEQGLTSLLLKSSVEDVDSSFTYLLKETVQRTHVEGLEVLTCGPVPLNPAEILSSQRMNLLLERVEGTAELVLIDSPPLLVADAIVLAARVDAVVMLIEPGKTQAAVAKRMMDQLDRAGARVIGAVLNRMSKGEVGYFEAYEYYSASTGKLEKENGRLRQGTLQNRIVNGSAKQSRNVQFFNRQ